jgi:hypothetical protein
MFIGHFGAGLAAKKWAPRVSLGTLFLGAQFIDLLWPGLLLLGIERVRIAPGETAGVPLAFEHYPVSHSLLAVLGWGALLGFIHHRLRGDRRGATVVGLLVLSHWLLDLIVHIPDLPLAPGGGPRVGFGLWHLPGVTLAVELGVFALGLWCYLRTTTAADAIGRWALAGLATALVGVQIGNAFGPPPPSVTAIAWVGQAQWLFVAWAFWVDRHRRPNGSNPVAPG